jgi:hypothetical protein
MVELTDQALVQVRYAKAHLTATEVALVRGDFTKEELEAQIAAAQEFLSTILGILA